MTSSSLQYYLHLFSLNSRSLKTIPEFAFFIMLGFFAMFALYFFFQWYKNFKRARNIEDTPTAKIRSAAQGYVEIEGKQRHIPIAPQISINVHQQGLTTPLSLLPCTWYRYTIDRGRGNKWYRLEQGESSQPFMLFDETGECIVDPNGAQITCSLKDCWQGFSKYPHGKPKNILMRFFSLFGNYRYTEWRMEDDMYLYVAGNFSTITDPQTHQAYNMLSKQGQNKNSPFILSSLDQKKLIRTYKLAAFAFLVGYSILLFIIGWMLVGRYF